MDKTNRLVGVLCFVFTVSFSAYNFAYGDNHNLVKSAIKCADDVYEYSKKTCDAYSLEEAKYYAEKAMKSAQCVKKSVYDVDALILSSSE